MRLLSCFYQNHPGFIPEGGVDLSEVFPGTEANGNAWKAAIEKNESELNTGRQSLITMGRSRNHSK